MTSGDESQRKHDVANIIRAMIVHEDDLVNQRMTWFLTIQGLLFAAMAFAWGKDGVLIWGVLAPLGIAISVSFHFTLNLGPAAVTELRESWDKYKGEYDGPDIVGKRVSRKVNIIWPWQSLPICVSTAWIAAGIIRVFR